MGNYRITICAVGNHGQYRTKKHGQEVDFGAAGFPTPDGEAAEFVARLKAMGENVSEATITHWPGTDSSVVDNLLTGKRVGHF